METINESRQIQGGTTNAKEDFTLTLLYVFNNITVVVFVLITRMSSV
jgi:hypothetical protein